MTYYPPSTPALSIDNDQDGFFVRDASGDIVSPVYPLESGAQGFIDDIMRGYELPLQVLRSAAGFYVGTEYYDAEFGCLVPNSRDSDYFATREQAQTYLSQLNNQ